MQQGVLSRVYEIHCNDCDTNLTYLFSNSSWGSCDLPHITAILSFKSRIGMYKTSMDCQKLRSQLPVLPKELPVQVVMCQLCT